LQKRQKKLLRSSCVKNSDIKPPDCNPPSAPPSLGHCSTGLVEGHRRFGRGRGNGTARRSTAVLCTSVVSSVEVGLRKAAIGSLDAGLRAGAAGPIEPVISSLVGGSLPPLIAFRSAKAPNTSIATTAMPSRVRRLWVSHGMAKRCRIIEHPPREGAFRLGGQREWEFYGTGDPVSRNGTRKLGSVLINPLRERDRSGV